MVFSEVTNDIEIMRPPEGTAYSFTAGADILAGQVVAIGSSDNTVVPSDGDGEQAFGVATQSVASGDEVMVVGSGGRVRFSAGGTVTRGQLVATHGDTGEEGEVANAATGDYFIGLAHETAADGETFIGTVVVGGQVN